MSASKKKQARREAALTDVKLTEKQKREQKEAQVHKRNVILGAVAGVVVVVLVVLLLVWHSGFFTRRTTALTVNGVNYTVADVDYYYYQALNSTYNNQQYYASLYAQMGVEMDGNLFDPSVSPKDQIVDPSAEEPQTYHQAFLESAKANLAQVAALSDAAKAAGYTLSADGQSDLDNALANLDAQVKNNNCASRSSYLKLAYGKSMTEAVYLRNLERNVLATDYADSVTGAMGNYSPEELDAYYAENSGTLDSYDYNYVYFSGVPASNTDEATGETIAPSDEEKASAMADAKVKADAVKEAVLHPADDATGDSLFSSAASAQGATASIRTAILGSEFSTLPFSEWMMDASRKAGDIDVFEAENSGYYVAQFKSRSRDDHPVVDVRHILISTGLTDDPETEMDERLDETNETVITKKAEAQAILDEYLAGSKTADAFGELAEKYSQDGRKQEDNSLNAAGGLYTGVKNGDMVPAFNSWIMDTSRQVGDTGLVLSEYGWHVMYFQATQDAAWRAQAASSKKTEEQTKWMEDVQAGYEATEASGISQVGR